MLPKSGSLQEQLTVEAGSRSNDAETPTLENLEAALKNTSLTFGETRQLMGRNQLAIYCGRTDASNGVDLTVCEYPTADQAKRGEAESNVVMNKMSGHSSRVNKKSVMHLIAPSTATPADLEAINKAFDAL